MKKYSRLRAVIDLDAVMYNMEMMHANIEKGTKMVVVIKTDGYGHGAVPISRMLEDVDYVWGYAVATLDEGVVQKSRHSEADSLPRMYFPGPDGRDDPS